MKPEDRDRYQRELIKALDRLDQLREEKSMVVKDFASRMAEAEMVARQYRSLLAGKTGEQVPLPVDVDDAPKKGGAR